MNPRKKEATLQLSKLMKSFFIGFLTQDSPEVKTQKLFKMVKIYYLHCSSNKGEKVAAKGNHGQDESHGKNI